MSALSSSDVASSVPILRSATAAKYLVVWFSRCVVGLVSTSCTALAAAGPTQGCGATRARAVTAAQRTVSARTSDLRRASSQDAPKGGKPTARPSQRRPPKAPTGGGGDAEGDGDQ